MRSTIVKILGVSLAAIGALSANPALAKHHHHHHRHHHHHHMPHHKPVHHPDHNQPVAPVKPGAPNKAPDKVCPPSNPICNSGPGRTTSSGG